jgi:hypothetical protein
MPAWVILLTCYEEEEKYIVHVRVVCNPNSPTMHAYHLKIIFLKDYPFPYIYTNIIYNPTKPFINPKDSSCLIMTNT